MSGPSTEWIFETTVLSAFALTGHLDLLERRYGGRAHWCVEVQHEVMRGVAAFPALGAIIGAAWLGDPIHSFAVDRIERTRQHLGGGPSDDRHRGEAATITVAKDNAWIVVTDDADATRVARAEGLQAISTPLILQACVRDGMLTAEEAKELLDVMIDDQGRRLPRLAVDDFG